MLLSITLLACLVDHETYNQRRAELTDADGDGYSQVDGDCDDANPEVNPSAIEVCDQLDNNCDGLEDDDDPDLSRAGWFEDADRDGFGGTEATGSCAESATWVDNQLDCDDTDATVSPEAQEVCNDFTDNDCNNDVTECRIIGRHNAGSGDTVIQPLHTIDNLGTSFAGAGDVDSDGLGDLLLGARGGFQDSVHLVSGSELRATIDVSPTDPGVYWTDGDRVGFGSSVGAAARTSVFGEPAAVVGGTNYLWWYSLPIISDIDASSYDGALALTGSDVELTEYLGYSAEIDYNSDGISDVVASQVRFDGTGAVLLLDSTFWDGGDASFGSTVAKTFEASGMVSPQISGALGDLNGDGVESICLSAPFLDTDFGTTGGSTLSIPLLRLGMVQSKTTLDRYLALSLVEHLGWGAAAR